MPAVHITGLGGYLPERVLSNHDLESLVETTDEWIRERTGIRQRHIIDKSQATSDMAVAAAQQALDDAGLNISDIDALVVATATPDMIFPATSTIVQAKLGGNSFPAWDVQAACSGFVYGLAHLDAMMRAGIFRRTLLIGAEAMTRIVDWTDRSTCVLFGDGAGAVVLEARDEEGGIVGSVLHADGKHRDLLMAEYAHRHGSPDAPAEERADLHVDSAGVAAVEMQGNEVFRMAVTMLGKVVSEVLKAHELEQGDVDWLIPHQANLRIIQATAKKLKLDMKHVAVTVDQHANTSAASVPLALNSMYREGRFSAGQLLLLEAFGAGFVWGANLLRWSKS
ncbi:MAG: beta-ketoacyl-ACP synthase III [Mariprofundaceae bacterium]